MEIHNKSSLALIHFLVVLITMLQHSCMGYSWRYSWQTPPNNGKNGGYSWGPPTNDGPGYGGFPWGPGYGSPPTPPKNGGYGYPSTPPNKGYGSPPTPPNTRYGSTPPPKTRYGSPPKPPKTRYGPPPTPPNKGYGSPPTPPNTGYGSPPTPPNTGYGSPPPPGAGTGDPNSQQAYLDAHNEARALVGVGKMKWSATVAAYAQRYANIRKADCALQHSVDDQYGECIAEGSDPQFSGADAVKLWVAEKAYYDHQSNTCASGQVCGHYTQVVWNNSVNLGCARVVCDNNLGVFVTCNYDPPGNYVGESPYSFT